jgi:hypothetical protein
MMGGCVVDEMSSVGRWALLESAAVLAWRSTHSFNGEMLRKVGLDQWKIRFWS